MSTATKLAEAATKGATDEHALHAVSHDLISPVVQKWIDEGIQDPEAFWGRAAEQLPWFNKWESVLEWTPPTFKWFVGARTNLAYNALDYHVKRGRGGHTALIYLNERGERRVYTYAHLLHEVERVAAALRGMGINKGDRLTVYMPTSPEAIILLLATVRIGAIHSVVFAGFGSKALGDRIQASGSRLVFTADVTYRKGKDTKLKEIVDEALENAGDQVEHVILLKRTPGDTPMKAGRDLTWDEFLTRGPGHSGDYVEMEANEPAFILATSGTTATPKLAIHTHGGYQVHIDAMGKWLFGLKESDVWWSTSDIGWIVGHSYIVYAPLIAGATTIAFEGALDYPAPESNWKALIEEYRVTGIFTSPTAVRLLMKYGDGPFGKHRLPRSGARLLRRRGAECAGLGVVAEEDLQEPHSGDRPHVADRNQRPHVRQSLWHRNAAHQAGQRDGPHAGHRGRSGADGRHTVRGERKRHHGDQAAIPRIDPGVVG